MTSYPDWFSQTAKPNFEKFLRPIAGQPHLKFLQLGVYTGDASVWLMENILGGPNCVLTDVDTWKGSNEEAHKSMDFDDVYKTYIKKTKRFDNIRLFCTTTIDFLLHETGCCDCSVFIEYDFIYIDADHTTAGVLVDAEIAWNVLKFDGILAFDDYTWNHESMDPWLAPKLGIDLFLHRHQGEYEVLEVNTQYWIRKK